jgi:hypothetical protein
MNVKIYLLNKKDFLNKNKPRKENINELDYTEVNVSIS